MKEKELLEGICETIEKIVPDGLDHDAEIKNFYERYVQTLLDQFTKVTISEEKYAQLKKFVSLAIASKRNQPQYLKDPGSLEKRYYTGWGGECAVAQFLGVDTVDFSIGNSIDYDVPDLIHAGFEVGVKTVSVGDFPLLRKPSPSTTNTPQIIVMKEDMYNYYICGLATYDVVNNVAFFKEALVRSKKVRDLGIKSAFYRFDLLTPLSLKALSPFKVPQAR